MRRPGRIFTPRGWTLLIVGVLGCLTTMIIGQADLVWIAALALALPLVAAATVLVRRPTLEASRNITPVRTQAGAPVTVHLMVRNGRRVSTGPVRCEEVLPAGFGERPRFSLDSLSPVHEQHVSYPLLPDLRGHYQLGPLLADSLDPMGLALTGRAVGDTSDLWVTPAVVPLEALRPAGTGVSGQAVVQRAGLLEPDDVLVREYRHGDDVRHVHWRTTAHHGELMVRREEQGWDPTAVLLLDSRANAHAGTGRSASFEWAVSATASIGLHLLSRAYRLRLLDAVQELAGGGDRDAQLDAEALLEAMTVQQLSAQRGLDTTVARLREGRWDLLVGVLGRLAPVDAAALAGVRESVTTALAFTLDVSSFASGEWGSREEQLRQEASRKLLDSGWRLVTVDRDTTVQDAWQAANQIVGIP